MGLLTLYYSWGKTLTGLNDTTLIVGGNGFTSSALVRAFAHLPLVVLSRSPQVRIETYAQNSDLSRVIWRVGDYASIVDTVLEFNPQRIIYTPSPYHGLIPSLVKNLTDIDYRGKLGAFTTAAITTSIPEQKKRWVAEGEEAMTRAPFPTVILRPTMIYGYPGDRNLERLLGFVKRSPFIPIPAGGENLVQPVHRDDLVRGMFQAMTSEVTGIFFASGPVSLPFKSLIAEAISAVRQRTGHGTLPISIPKWTIDSARVFMNRVWKDKLDRFFESRAVDGSRFHNELLGGRAISFSEGIFKEAALLFQPNASTANSSH